MSTRLIVFSALAAFSLVSLSGCASTEPDKKSAAEINPDKERVSTIPWSKPESWEGQGSMGGLGGAIGGH